MGTKNCFIKHTIYLAVSSGLKIGITRAYQEQNRWIDQGASYALPIARVYTRKDSGLIESSLSKYIADKTNWRKMLLGDLPQLDLKNKREEIWNLFPEDVNHEKLHEEEVRTFHYPVIEPPKKIKSFNLDKSPQIEDLLQGVKGQYLIFATGVINIRKYSGYQVALQIH